MVVRLLEAQSKEMSDKLSQKERVEKMFKEQGFVSRNYFIDLEYNKITRLGALICDMRKDGWLIDTKITKSPKDTIYTATPKRVEKWIVMFPEGDKVIEKKIFI